MRILLPSVAALAAALTCLAAPRAASAAPITAAGDSFVAVGQGPQGVQLYDLVAAPDGRIFIGNNSNSSSGVPVQVFDPSQYHGTPIDFGTIGDAVGDADGLTGGGGYLYAPDFPEGVQRIDMSTGATTLFLPGVATNGAGSPLLASGADGSLYVSYGNGGPAQIDRYSAAGVHMATYSVGSSIESMTIDPATGAIYYVDGPFTTSFVRRLDPTTGQSTSIGSANVGIDGALYFDSLSGLIFAGGANGTNAGTIYTIDPHTGAATLFATGGGTGFGGILGIARSPADGNLYILDSQSSGARSILYRLPTAAVDEQIGVPEPGSLALAALGAAAVLRRRKRIV